MRPVHALRRVGVFAALVGMVAANACSDNLTPERSPRMLAIVQGDTQVGAAGAQLGKPLTVRALTADSQPVVGARVLFRVVAGSASLATNATETDATGSASTLVTPTAPGNIVVRASLQSSSLSVTFLLAAQGAAAACDSTLALAPAEIVPDVGGSRVCVAGGASGGTYMVVAFNSDTVAADSIGIVVNMSGLAAIAGASIVADATPRDPVLTKPADAHLAQLLSSSAEWNAGAPGGRHAALAGDTVGNVRQLNVKLDESCSAPTLRGARVVAVTRTAVIVADTTNPPSGFTNADYLSIGASFDTLWSPVDTLSFKPPADIDTNTKIVLFVTSAVNALPADANGRRLAVAQRRDVFPKTSATGATVCPSGNAAELLYLAAVDASGAAGPALSRADLLRDLGRQVVHEYQHLINASRRVYVTRTQVFEDRWLDEAISHVAEELLFQQAAPRQSRQNLGSYELSLTQQTLAAFTAFQRPNLERYRAYLGSTRSASPLLSATPVGRGAGWSLLRYLVDQRAYLDYVSLSALANSPTAGFDNLQTVFGSSLRQRLRDWSISLYTDDLFATRTEYQQPSWNYGSIFSALSEPYGLTTIPLSGAGAGPIMIAALGSAYFRFSVPANGTAAVAWAGAAAGTISPFIRWTLIRAQ